MSSGFTIDAPCKINLHLRILGRRNDGFHDLESLFLALAWGDTLHVELGPGSGACVVAMDREFSGENLIEKAVKLFRAYTGFSRSLRIDVEKRLPLGAGLGGASSDAAAVLKALNILAETGLSGDELRRLGLRLGSDVPFFFSSGAAYVSGRGERLEPVLPPGGIGIVLVSPDFSSSTAEAFGLLDRVRTGAFSPGCSKEALIEALDGDPALWPYTNDFLGLFVEHGPPEQGAEYQRILEDLKRGGAAFAGLSGSGSSCFGVFKEQEAAQRVKEALSSPRNLVTVTFPLRIAPMGY